MARKKVKLAWIANDSARRATFKKRRKGLMKKVSELSTLCDVMSCAIIYGPDEPRPEVWPSLQDATRVLTQFKSMPEMEQSKKMMDQEGFLRHQVMKLQEYLRKQQRENREKEMALLMYKSLSGPRSLHELRIEEVTSLAMMVEAKMKIVQDKLEVQLSTTSMQPNDARMVANGVVAPDNNQWEVATMESLQRQSWYNDLMNPNEPVVFGGGEELMQSYIDTNHSLDPYYWN